ncbi:efflux RND transporter periplasmic adaptor subunit [Brumimicrobium mesophilum]|uniref:efflux RND transporter periplasmic adaptor subunit n=1 Tax=Brumimicrobium mesophilum TaxID=392717 RepID=UPI0018FE7689|nr:efflux RND transporter periplasmic adaptor subunit [Brumimicrobium mesophilum]
MKNRKTIYIAISTLVLGLLLGWMIFGSAEESSKTEEVHDHSEETVWTCSMHPQIRANEPGACPLCGMDLIPLSNESDDGNPLEVRMSPTAMQLANVQTSIVSKQKPVKDVRMNGKVKTDERNVFSQSSHIPGRIEKLTVNFTGEAVQKGQVLAYIYSPELVAAQEELLEAQKMKETQPSLFNAAKEKLKNWKLTEKHVNQILANGKIQEQFPILADVSGIVTDKKINLGDYILKGQSLYEIADISSVWVLFDVYESDIPWIKQGDKVEFTVRALPNEKFKGEVSFIDPVINSETRVASARVILKNPGQRLKPDMFVQGTIKSQLDVNEEVIVVPKSAVMWTGERSVVYVKNASSDKVSFLMKMVTLGPSLGDGYLIKEGLEVGEEIATNGTFSIDAAAQLAGKPSMMNPEGGVPVSGHNHGETTHSESMSTEEIAVGQKEKAALSPLFEAYFKLKNNLVNDNFKAGISSAKEMTAFLNKVDMKIFKGDAHNFWMKRSDVLSKELKKAISTKEIGELRKPFEEISNQLIMILKSFGAMDKAIYIEHCPMVNNNKGADWLSLEPEIKNPYYGDAMLKCGEVKEVIGK